MRKTANPFFSIVISEADDRIGGREMRRALLLAGGESRKVRSGIGDQGLTAGPSFEYVDVQGGRPA